MKSKRALWKSIPIPRINYIERSNEIIRPSIKEKDNAWPEYKKAIEAYVPDDELELILGGRWEREAKLAEMTERQRKALGGWLGKNKLAWRHFKRATEKSYCCRPYKTDSNAQIPSLLRDLELSGMAELRGLWYAGLWKSRFTLSKGDTEEALNNCLALIVFGRHWQGKGTFVEQLAGLGVQDSGCKQMLEIIYSANLSPKQDLWLQQQIASIYAQGYPELNTTMEKFMLLDVIQHTFTRGGIGGGHLIPKKTNWILKVIRRENRPEDKLLQGTFIVGMSMVHARREDTIAKAQQIYNKMEKLTKMSPYQRKSVEGSFDKLIRQTPKYRYWMLGYLAPAINRITNHRYDSKSLYESTVTIVALARYRQEQGNYPESLYQLVEESYLTKLPADPYSGQPLIYRKTDTGFTLYSVVRNFEDNCGIPGQDREQNIKLWADNGDAVFWPVAQPNNTENQNDGE